jgi:acetyl esterase/lipase
MMRVCSGLLLVAMAMLGVAPAVSAGGEPEFTRKEDVIYGRKFGTALTLDVLTPKKANGAAVIFVVSGGWVSNHDAINPNSINVFLKEFLRRGYTVFAVVHGCQPKFTIPEIVQDMNRAVRFIRLHAKEYGIDPDRIGITGGSAGGHLSLMQGCAGDLGNDKAKDPIDRTSSRVQAVACLYPPTDFFNYGEQGKYALAPEGTLKAFRPPFDFHELDKQTGRFERITDEKRVEELMRRICPITHVSPDDPPTLIMHGDKDALVPIQQAEIMIAKLREAKVPAELVIKKGAAHGWKELDKDMPILADWFDKHLKPAPKGP